MELDLPSPPPEERLHGSSAVHQLTAIMFTDMVGYTALMQVDERQGSTPTCSRSMDAAVIHKGLGDRDAAFEHLGRAVDDRIGGVVFIPSGPLCASVRSDPRYPALAARIGVPVGSLS